MFFFFFFQEYKRLEREIEENWPNPLQVTSQQPQKSGVILSAASSLTEKTPNSHQLKTVIALLTLELMYSKFFMLISYKLILFYLCQKFINATYERYLYVDSNKMRPKNVDE